MSFTLVDSRPKKNSNGTLHCFLYIFTSFLAAPFFFFIVFHICIFFIGIIISVEIPEMEPDSEKVISILKEIPEAKNKFIRKYKRTPNDFTEFNESGFSNYDFSKEYIHGYIFRLKPNGFEIMAIQVNVNK